MMVLPRQIPRQEQMTRSMRGSRECRVDLLPPLVFEKDEAARLLRCSWREMELEMVTKGLLGLKRET